MAVPTIITTKLAKLEQLCEKYPQKIPIEECAAFLGMAGESLRACLEHGSCPFGLGWLRYSRCYCWRYSPSVRTGRRAHEKRRCQDGNPDQRQRKIYSTT